MYSTDQITSDDEELDHRNNQEPIEDDDDNLLFDYHQNIARASFDDMVHDCERNQLYYRAIEKSVRKLRAMNQEVFALDIGSGTGLLSMMAIKAGANRVLACECFEPMASCSRKIIDQNFMSACIQVVNKRSEQMNIENPKPNLLVAELLDTELIGEGCLSIYRDVIKRCLVRPDSLFVPTRGRIWIQLVQSKQMFCYHQFQKSFCINDQIEIKSPPVVRNCFGSHLLHDVQLNRLKPDEDFEILSDPIMVFEFQFNRLESLKPWDYRRVKLHLKRTFDKPIMLFSWWDIDLDEDGEIKLSCGPYWARGLYSEDHVAWREHWMQTIYYLPAFAFNDDHQVDGFQYDQINQSKTLLVDAFHDSFSLWFDLPNQTEPADEQQQSVQTSESWFCTCGLHSHLSRSRLYWLNNLDHYRAYWKALNMILENRLSKKETESKDISKYRLVYFGDESILPLLCACHSRVHEVFVIVNDRKSYKFFNVFRLGQNENLSRKIILCSHKSFQNICHNDLDGIITDLHFRNNSILFPSLEFFHQIQRHPYLSEIPRQNRFSIPCRIVIRCLLIRFEHLWKCSAPVKNVEISDEKILMCEYDKLILNARQAVDWQFEHKFLWEYRSWPLISKPIDLYEFSLVDSTIEMQFPIQQVVKIDLEHLRGNFDQVDPESVAIVCWLDQYLSIKDGDRDIIRSGGLVESQLQQLLSLDAEIKWIREQPQVVTFLRSTHYGISSWKKQMGQHDIQLHPTLNLKFQLFIKEFSLKVDVIKNDDYPESICKKF